VIIQEKVPAFPLSIVIPSLNEEKALPGVLASLERQEDDPPFELVLADGGSADATVPRFLELTCSWAVRGRAARAVRCAKSGRAAQLNMGAREAAGKALLFLHADTTLPAGATRAVLRALSDPEVIGGAFRHAFAEGGLLLSLISFWANSRSRLGGVHLGDQAMFARRSDFEEIGGFPEVPLFEDLRLSRALRLRGRVVTLPLAAVTSARRLREAGALKMGIRYAWLELRHVLGADPARLKDEYPDVR
jgi:rSAM/selenodomain-associated transferase 2